MDKNIAAILNHNAATAAVTLNEDSKQTRYTYVFDRTRLDLKVGDAVVVHARNQMCLAVVQEVHEDLQIAPNDHMKYNWVIDRINVDRYNEQMGINQQIERTLGKAYQSSMRRSFAQTIMAELPEETKAQLAGLLGGEPK